jgi:MoaA/NifB/PqqE/SkfB family radical SAM enzyme
MVAGYGKSQKTMNAIVKQVSLTFCQQRFSTVPSSTALSFGSRTKSHALLTLEPTNACNCACLHCMQNKADPAEFMPLDLADKILVQARSLGLTWVLLTGGEIALYPHLEELLGLIVKHGFYFTLVTNGSRFQERLLPLFLEPNIRKKNGGVSLSLDGARAETHDLLRRTGSFNEVIEAAGLCKLKNIPLFLKTVITTYNRDELTELALLGAGLGVKEHEFMIPCPTPRLLKERAIPPPNELAQINKWIQGTLTRIVRSNIRAESYLADSGFVTDCGAWRNIAVDSGGRQLICCNLSHLDAGDGKPTRYGEELLADLSEVPLKEGMRRHFYALARLMEARLKVAETVNGLNRYMCYWCMKEFGKLEWLKEFPDSPWAAGV